MKFRSEITFYLNDRRQVVDGERAFITLSDFLRYERGLTGTKVVCAEGDCGACTVLLASIHELDKERLNFKSVNSCILPMWAVDGCYLTTVEGLKDGDRLHPVQSAMVSEFGSQCGYCTPGFVCAMTAMVEDSLVQKKEITEKRVKNYLTGNLCRCTGYTPIINAALSLSAGKHGDTPIETLRSRFHDAKKVEDLKRLVKTPVEVTAGTLKLFLPATLPQALTYKTKYPEARIVAGATDLGVVVNKGRDQYQHVMSLQNIAALWKAEASKSRISIGSRVTLASAQKYLDSHAPEFDRMMNLFASPQIKNTGTVVGNIVNASPISDTIPFFAVNDAVIEVRSKAKKRLIPFDEFFLGYKKLNIKKNELVTAVHLPRHSGRQVSKLYKVSLRKDLDISAVTMAARFKLVDGRIAESRIAFGGVGPVVARIKGLESKCMGADYGAEIFEELSREIGNFVKPISDVRGSAEYRLLLCRNLLLKFASEIREESTT